MNYINIKKIFFFILPVLFLHTFALAQSQEDKRTLQTRIADVLAQFPADDSAHFNSLMNEVAVIGEPGILEMAQMLAPPGKGDNTQLEYALGGFSFYANSANKEELRLMSSNAYSKALEVATDADIKAFFIRQLQIVGEDEAVANLKKYLNNERLCNPAVRALVNIHTPSAQEALLNALSSARGDCQYSLIKALGDVRFTAAVDALAPLVESSDMKTKKMALYALANIGDPSSEDLLADEAKNAGYILNETNATASFLLWSKRTAEEGNVKSVEKLAKKLLKKLDQENQVHTRTAFLKLLVDIKEETAMSALLAAAKDENPEYRAAALKYALPLEGTEFTNQWVKQMEKADPEAKADIINMLGKRNDKTAYSAVAQALDSNDPAVKLAAIKSSAKLGPESSLPKLLEMMKTADNEKVDAIKVSLLTMEGDNIVPKVADAISETPSYGKAALLEVLGARKASAESDKVLALANAQDPVVRLAALKALENMATQKNLSSLYPLLLAVNNEEELVSIQTAIINALITEEKSRGTDLVIQQMAQAPPDKKHRYYNILASIGSDKALVALSNEFQKGNIVAKKAAIAAMSNWVNFSGGRALLEIARSAEDSQLFDQALKGYIHQVSISTNTPENKYLFLREAMEIARSPEQKKIIMREIGNSNSLPALSYAGRFLNNNEVQQEAAHAVMNIALSNSELYGTEVKKLLTQSMHLLEGQESAYLKEAVRKHLEELPEGPGFVALFNGKDLTGWKGLVANPLKRASMNAKALAREQEKSDAAMRKAWIVEDGVLVFTGEGDNISTEKKYNDFEMYVDWKITKDGDAGIYLRGTPQVQIWDTARHEVGAQVGSGGLYNNQTHKSKPSSVEDNPVGEWNTFHIIMKGERVTVYLNGEQVVDNVIMENYWDRGQPIFPEEQIELQAHGTRVEYRDIYLREIPRAEPFELSEAEKEAGFKVLFDGTGMHHFMGNTQDYIIENGNIVIYPERGGKGNLFTKDQYSDFIFRFEFQLTPGANNGLGIRAPLEGDAAYEGMEVQILDNTADIYKNLEPYQYHGSVYGILAAERGHLKPVGEWNYEEVRIQGSKIKVTLNGEVILESDLSEAIKNGTLDGKDHPGLKRDTGHIGFLGHGSEVRFRNIRVKELGK